jgi:hypothetical protein
MKTKANLLFLAALFFTALQGCSVGYMSNNGSSTNEIQNSGNQDNQDNLVNQDYNVDELNQYGDWDNLNSYGRVWHPSVASGWQPFTNGHWDYDGYDWVWVSYEPFGWMVYHYGSWENTPEYGWVWLPEEDQWSPANVQWIYYDDQVGWAPRRGHGRSWSEPWNQDNAHPWVVVRMEDFNRENVVSYRMNNVPTGGTGQSSIIERRQPDLKIVQQRVKEPIQIVKIVREPVLRNPVRTNVTPPVERTPVRTDVTPPVDRNPGRTDVTPPVQRTPVRNDTPPVVRNQNPPPQNSRPIYRMQIPPQEKQKVDRYQPQVEKNVLRKKAPVTNDNRNKPTNTDTKQRNDQEKK